MATKYIEARIDITSHEEYTLSIIRMFAFAAAVFVTVVLCCVIVAGFR
jgi:hypothetical protein